MPSQTSFSDLINRGLAAAGLSEEQTLYALHLAVQSAVAVAVTFIAMRTLGMPEKFVGLLSAVLVIQPSVGNTLSAAVDRALATVVGSVIGLACIFAIPFGYGTAISLAIAMFAINLVAGFRPDWRYGVVAGVAIALGAESQAVDTAVDRFLSIVLGGSIGVAVALLVWPETASRRADRKLRSALNACADLLSANIARATGNGDSDVDKARQRYTNAISEARTAAGGVNIADDSPIDARLDQIEKLYTSIVLIERVSDADEDAAVANGSNFNEALSGFRKKACDIISCLTDGKAISDDAFDELRQLRDEALENAQHDSDAKLASMLDHALGFGLGEIALSLENLKNAFDETYQGSVLDWSANLARGDLQRPNINLGSATSQAGS